MSELSDLRARLHRLKAAGREPTNIIMSGPTWDRLKAEYLAESGRDSALTISGREVLGAPLELHPDTLTIAIWWENDDDSGIDE